MAAETMRKIFSILVIFYFVVVSCDVAERKVQIIPWPNCDDNYCKQAKAEGLNVVYAKAQAQSDDLLYAFSTIGTPTVVLARVIGTNNEMRFEWEKLINMSSLEDAITITGTIKYKFGVAFTRLFEYYDVDDSADLEYVDRTPNNSNSWIIKDLNSFNWTLESVGKNSFVFNATNATFEREDSVSSGNWSISFSFTVRGDSGRSSELPSLKYGANVTQFDFVIANYTPSFNKSRFAIEAVMASQSTNKDVTIESINSIDDEYSPGVFQIVNWLPDSTAQESTSFFQWKPVCYNSNSRSRSSATEVKHYDVIGVIDRENTTLLMNTSILFALFGKDLYNEQTITVRATNISFGLSQDGFYVQNNYTAWTAAIGYGIPPADSISLTVIVIISAGLGLPVIILILGGVYTCVRKARQRKAGYQIINTEHVSRTSPMVN